MKIIRNILSVAGILLSLQLLHAQTALIGSVNDVATPIQAAQQDSVVQVAAEAQGLQLVPPDQVPRGGTFWWMMPNGNSAPLPCPPSDPNIPIYLIAPGQFLVDETGGRVVLNSTLARLQGATPTVASALEAQANAVVNLIAQVQTMAATPKGRFSPSMMMASSFAGSFAYGNSVYLKNMTATASSGSSLTAGFSITGGTNFVPYDILMTTNLLLPVSSWNWLGIGYTSNNYTFNGQPANQAFYMLAKPSKTMTVGFGNDVVAQCDVPVGLTNVLQVAGGGGQSLALKTDGTVVAWGQNYFGEGTVPPTLGRVAMISAGWYHNVALLTNGTVTAWGANNSMLFGGMYLTNVPSNLTNAIVISAQAFHSLALASNGTVVAWGYGGFGEASVPAGLSNVVAIAAGYQHNLAVKSDGTVFPWGRNYSGDCTIPTGLCNVVDVAAGVYHSLALLNNGTVIAWGDNSFGESSVPVGLSNVVAIAAAGGLNSGGLLATAYSLALKSDGSVVAWGSDEAVDPVGGLSNVIAMAAGADHALAVRTGPPTPVITLEPVDEYQVQGSNVTFTARGAGLYGVAYQWQTNGVNLSGATQAALTLTNVQPAQLVSYDVVVSNEAGSLVSSNASLYFVTPPVINSLTLPTNQVAIYQSNLLLSVSASAPGQYNGFPLSYQWQFNGSNIAKATSSSYTLHANAISFGAYSVLVSNAAGSTNAAWLVAVYYPGLLISQQPTNQYQIAGGKVTFAGSGVASNSVTYQWTCNGTNIAWATNGVLVLTNVTAAQEGVYNFTVSDGISILTSSNAWFYLVPPPAISSQTLPTNVVCIYGNYLSFAAAATAPYQTNGYPLHYQWQFNGTNIPSATTTNYSFFASDSSSGTYSLAVTNRAGSASASWQVTVTNAINVTNDLLLIYNTNSTDSATVLNYYLAHRPGVSGANVLGIGYTNPISTGYYETVTPTDLTNQIFAPVVSWLISNPAKRPQYVVLFMDLPSRVNTNCTMPTFPGYPGSGVYPSVSIQFQSIIPNWKPFTTHLNMGMTSTMNRSNDCIAYIDKLAALGTFVSSNNAIISASAGGYGCTNFILDNVRFNVTNEMWAFNGSVISAATNALLATGVSPKAIYYYDGLITNFPPTASDIPPRATNNSNVGGYACWGVHGDISTSQTVDGTIAWKGSSSWWLINTVDSYNGQQVMFSGSQNSFVYWFSSTAFGGTNYSNTPVGAVTTVDEPGLPYKNDNTIYFGLWASGKNFGICAWNSKLSEKFQAVGDPLITK